MLEGGVVAPPGLERADSGNLNSGLERVDSGNFKASAPVFEPGAIEFKIPNSPSDTWSPPSTAADGDLLDKTTWQYMYSQLLLQYNVEVPYLRHQVIELTSKLAELDGWKVQTMGLVRDLRDQHRALRRKIGDDPPAPPQTPPTGLLEQKPTEAHHAPSAVEASAPVRPSPPTASPPQPPGQDFFPSGHTGAAPREFDAETGLMIYETKVDGIDAMRAEWKVNHFSTKLRGAMGRPVVSAPFDFWGLEEMRMMITPEQQESNTGPRSRKEKEQFSKMVTDGPLFACLTLKVPNSRPVRLKYQTRVGDKTSVFFECDFSNTAIDNRGVFKHVDGSIVNWLLEMKESSIIVGVEMQRPTTEDADVDMLKDNKDEDMPPQDDHPGAPPGLGPPAEKLTNASGV